MDKLIKDTLEYYMLSEETKHIRKCYTQGDLFECLVKGYYHEPPSSKKNRVIHDFSKQARLRLLRKSATIAWNDVEPSQFLTFGYPDQCLPRNKDRRRWDRQEWIRDVEEAKGKHITGIWRCEWVPRLTGSFVGYLMPHYHMIFVGVGKFPYKAARESWKRIIHSPVEPNMRFKLLDTPQRAGYYIGKYCAKEPDYKLGNLPNCNTIDGQHYGYFRKDEIPTRPVQWYQSLSHEQYIGLRDHCAQEASWLDTTSVKSFTCFGGRSVGAIMKILSMGLDKDTSVV